MIYSETHIKSENSDWIIFVHGAGGNISTWKYQIPFFKRHFNLLLFDLRGHGQSLSQDEEKPYTFDSVATDLKSLIEKHKIERGHFIGLSIGSLIIHKYAEIEPEKVLSISSSGGIYKITWKIHWFSKLAHLLVRAFPYHSLYRFFALIVMPKANHAKARKIFNYASSKIEQREYIRWLNLYGTFRQTVNSIDFEKLNKKVLVVMGEEDHLFLKPARDFCSYYSNANLKVIPKCGHICNLEKADEFNTLVYDFLKNL